MVQIQSALFSVNKISVAHVHSDYSDRSEQLLQDYMVHKTKNIYYLGLY